MAACSGRRTSVSARQDAGPSNYGNSVVKHMTATQGSTVTASEDEVEASGSAHTARLWNWAQRSSWNAGPRGARRLKDITLEHVLSGETCAPIQLADFEQFLAHCDHSLENLQFVVWYLDYRARYDALSDEQRHLSPLPSRKPPARFNTPITPDEFANVTHLSTELKSGIDMPRIPASNSQSPLPYSPVTFPSPVFTLTDTSNTCREAPSTPTSPAPAYCAPDPGINHSENDLDVAGFYAYAYSSSFSPLTSTGSRTRNGVTTLSDTLSISSPSTTHPGPLPDSNQAPKLPASLSLTPTSPRFPCPAPKSINAQPFRSEIQQVLTTFVLPNSCKELLLDSEERDRAIFEARYTTHPEVFAPIHATCMNHLRLVSLPRFLLNGATNMNRPKQVYWYIIGFLNIFIGVALALIVVLCPLERWMVSAKHSHSSAHRAWRLLGLPLFALGTAQCYSAYRGYCSQIWFRGATQLRPWELDARDLEAGEGGGENGLSDFAGSRKKKSGRENDAAMNVKGRIAPFLDLESYPSSPTSSISFDKPLDPNGDVRHEESRAETNSKQLAKGLMRNAASRHRRRPPIFGPERIVEDETIRAVHAQVWRDLLKFGIAWGVVYIVVVVSVPSLQIGVYA